MLVAFFTFIFLGGFLELPLLLALFLAVCVYINRKNKQQYC